MNMNISEIKGRSKLEKRLLAELRLVRYQLDQLKQESQQGMTEVQQIRELLKRKPQPLLIGR